MSGITYNPAVVAQGLARLLSQFKGKPRIAALLTSWLKEFQELEDSFWAFFTQRLLQNAEAGGDLLDKLGDIVGQLRGGQPDNIYLILVMARLRANRSTGRIQDFYDLLGLLATGLPIVFTYLGKMAFSIFVSAPLPVPPDIVALQFLLPAVAAGERLDFIYTGVPLANTLIFGSVRAGAVVPMANQSFGSVTVPNSGGVAAGLFSLLGGSA